MVIQKAVKGMLPRGPLGRAMFRKLKVYAGAEHNACSTAETTGYNTEQEHYGR